MCIRDRCKRVELQCSIDGFGKVNDYQRTGADWTTVSNHLLWYQQNMPEVCGTVILTSWSILNVSSAIDLMSYVRAHLPRFLVWGHLVREPAHLDMKNAPAEMKSKLLDRLDAWTELDELHWVLHNKQVISSQLRQAPLLRANEVLVLSLIHI